MGIVGAAVIPRWAYGLSRQTSKPLLGENLHLDEQQQIEKVLSECEHADLVDFQVWQISPRHRAAIIGIVSDNPRPPEDYRRRLRQAGFHYAYLTVEVHDRA